MEKDIKLLKQMFQMYLDKSKFGKEYVKAVCCHPAYLTYMQSTSWNAGLDEA